MPMNKHLLAGLLLAVPIFPALAAAPASLPPVLDEAAQAVVGPAANWAALAPAEQRELRARYAAWRALPAAERQRIRSAAAALAALAPDKREELRQRFLGLDRLQRDGWRLGPQLGAVYPQLQSLLGYLPQAQREPMLALLHQLDAQQLAQLAVLAQRTAPPQRDALREQLLAVPAAERGQWLRQQLAR